MKYKCMRVLMLTAALLFIGGTDISTVFAADEKPVVSAPTNQESLDKLQQAYADIEQQRQTIKDLQARLVKTTGLTQKAIEVRLDKAWLNLLEQDLVFAKAVAEQEKAEVEVGKYQQHAIDVLTSQFYIGSTAIKRIQSRIEVPKPDLSAAEQAAAYSRVFNTLATLNQAYETTILSLQLAQQFEIDVSKQEMSLKEELSERAATGSILLEMAMDDVTALRASVSAVPDDAELKAKLTVATNHVRNLAEGLSAVLVMMESLEMDTSAYQQQLLGATGEITTDVFEVSVVTSLLVGWGEKLWTVMIEDGPNLLFKIILFLLIVLGFRKLGDFVKTIVERALEKSHLNMTELLRRMIVSIVRNTIFIIGILIALSQLGISLGPLLAGLGVAGFVIGFALQDSLSNFAAGMMILMYRPFDVGDLIEAGGVSGKVSKMNLVNTTILTLDNQTIVVPNNKIWGDVVKNVTAQTRRRIDMVFGIGYADDIPKTERVLQEILDSHEKVLAEPESIVRLHELADSSVNFVVRPWVKKEDYWEVYWDITRAVKMRFDEEGISIPFPQRDVHVYNEQ